MVLACSVEIVSVIRDEYRSFKSNPANGHYGYAVIFHGADPVRRIDLEFPVTRLFTRENVIATTYTGQWFQTAQIGVSLRNLYNCLALPVKLCADLVMEVADPIALPGHPETVVKVKVPPGSQFNIICYWVDIPGVGVTTLEIDPSDGSDGLDEYPEPKRNPQDEPWQGNPGPNTEDPANDPRDYGDGVFSAGWEPDKNTILYVSGEANDGACNIISVPTQILAIGPRPSPVARLELGELQEPQPCPGETIHIGVYIFLADGTRLGPYLDLTGWASATLENVIYQ